MSMQVEGCFKSFVAAGALVAFTRVKMSGAKVTNAGDEERGIGIVQNAAAADGDMVSVRLTNAGGTVKAVAHAAITAGAAVYAAANGELDASGTLVIGYACEASTADNDIIEYIPQDGA
jgi:hypothetical protein